MNDCLAEAGSPTAGRSASERAASKTKLAKLAGQSERNAGGLKPLGAQAYRIQNWRSHPIV